MIWLINLKAGSVAYSPVMEMKLLVGYMKEEQKYTNIAVSRDFGRSDHMSFYPKQIPDLNFAHKPIQNEYHCENDIIENINPNMLAYVANAVQIIALEIMSESTPSYISIAKPIPDNTVYTIENNIRIPFGWLTEFEKTTGIKLSQIPSADTNAVYQAKVKMFGMPEILTLTASSGIGVIGGVEHFSVNMQQVGITFEKLNEVLTIYLVHLLKTRFKKQILLYMTGTIFLETHTALYLTRVTILILFILYGIEALLMRKDIP